MKAILFVSITCIILKFSCSNENNEEILAVSLFYRHGDRPPMSFYPNDPYQDPSLWSAPLGELTNMGKMQHFKLGKWLRNRYNGFLSPIYYREQIYIHSSNNDRCLMSALANLAGLYTPILKDIWNKNLSWQPIPIHTAPEKNDDIVEVPDSCFIYNFLKEKAQSEIPYFRNINQENEKFFEYLSKQTGSNISNIVEASYIYSTLNSEKNHNFTLPSWSLEVYPHLKELGDTAPKLFTATPQLTRLFIGRYFNDVLDQFKFHSGRIEKKSESLRIFSGHDDQVFSILSALKVPKLEAVPYAAVIILELKRYSNGHFFVELLYKTEENAADVLKIPNCDEHCSFDKFIEIVQPIALTEEEFDEECKISYSHIDLYYDSL